MSVVIFWFIEILHDFLFLSQASGVTVTDACKQVFEKIKTKKDFRYVVFFIKDEKFIDVESTGMNLKIWLHARHLTFSFLEKKNRTGTRESTYEEFLDHLKIIGTGGEKECRYGLFDFEYTHQCQGTQEVSLLC